MRKPVIVFIVLLLASSIVWQVSASLIGTASPDFLDQMISASSPAAVQAPVAVSDDTGPLVISGSMTSDIAPLNLNGNPLSSLVAGTKVNHSPVSTGWSPVMNGQLSPFQDVSSLGGASVEVRPTDEIMKTIVSTIPLGISMTGNKSQSL